MTRSIRLFVCLIAILAPPSALAQVAYVYVPTPKGIATLLECHVQGQCAVFPLQRSGTHHQVYGDHRHFWRHCFDGLGQI